MGAQNQELRVVVLRLLVLGERVELSHGYNATHGVLCLADPHWPRAVLGLRYRDCVPTESNLFSIAEYLLELAGSPTRWTSDLSFYLQTSQSDFNGPDWGIDLTAEGARLAQSLRIGTTAGPVWDLCTGRVLEMSALQSRAEIYESTPANAGDLNLETRFIDYEMIIKENPWEGIEELEGLLSWVRLHQLPILDLKSAFGQHTLVIQHTVRTWLDSHCDQDESTEEIVQKLTSVLAAMLNIFEHGAYARVRDRAAELYREYQNEKLASTGI